MDSFGTLFQWEMKNDGSTREVWIIIQWTKWNILNLFNSIRRAYVNDIPSKCLNFAFTCYNEVINKDGYVIPKKYRLFKMHNPSCQRT